MSPEEIKAGVIIQAGPDDNPIKRKIVSVGGKMSMVAPLGENYGYAIHNEDLIRRWKVSTDQKG